MASTITRYLVVDDDDPSITYSGSGWFHDARWNGYGFNGNLYGGTEHAVSENSSLTFSYNGQGYVIAYGTTPFINSTTPSWTCSIDGTEAINYEGPRAAIANNWHLCFGRMAEDVRHTFRIDINEASNFPFYLDYIVYEPSPDDRHENVDVYLFSTDPNFRYEGQWDLLTEDVLATTQSGASARLDFVGSSVSTYAFIEAMNAATGSTGSYNIDGGEEIRFFWKGTTGANGTLGNQLLFTTPNLEIGAHSLNITYLSNDIQTAPLSINFVIIHNGSFPVMTTVPVSSGPGSDGGGLGRSGTIGISVAIPLAVFALLAGAFLFLRHRSQQRSRVSVHRRDEIIPTPFSYLPTQQQQQRIYSPKGGKHRQAGSTGPVVMDPVTLNRGNSDLLPTSSSSQATPTLGITRLNPLSQLRPQSDAVVQDTGPSLQQFGEVKSTRHVDSGIRFQDPDLPPFYTTN